MRYLYSGVVCEQSRDLHRTRTAIQTPPTTTTKNKKESDVALRGGRTLNLEM
jgi:hypothetical protein